MPGFKKPKVGMTKPRKPSSRKPKGAGAAKTIKGKAVLPRANKRGY